MVTGRGLLRSTGVIGAMTLLSRILGLVRDVVFARLFGAGYAMDAFVYANRIPNMFRRFFAEGAFSQAFVPVLNEVREHGDAQAVRQLTDAVAGTLGVVLFVITLIGVVAAPLFVLAIAPGLLADDAAFDLTVLMLRFTFPYLLFISLTAMAAGLLNTYGRFAVPAFTPVLLNVSLIGFAVFVSPKLEQPTLALAFGVFVAGVVQLAFQLPFLKAIGHLPRPRWAWRDSGVRKIGRLMVPAIFGSSVVQINLLIDNILASLLGEARVTWLYFSDRLMEFPLGVFGIALATAILPSLSRNFANEDRDSFTATLDWSLRLVVLVALPATLGLALLAGPLVTTIFYGGVFDAFDVRMARASLWAFSGGLLAFIAIKVLSPGYFARQDTKTPVKVGLVALGVNLVCNLGFVYVLMQLEVEATHAGLALATTVAAFVNAALLYLGLRRSGQLASLPGWLSFIFRVAVAGALMAAFLLWLSPPLDWWLEAQVLDRVLRLLLLIAGGAALYFAALFASGLRPAHLKLDAATARIVNGAGR
ncbi:MAG: murein biosynthesis integral membrane protein MurJ [Pseudomonadota bacterium]